MIEDNNIWKVESVSKNRILQKKLFLAALFFILFGANLKSATIIGADPDIDSVDDIKIKGEEDFWYPRDERLNPGKFKSSDRILNFVGINGISIKLKPLDYSKTQPKGDSIQSSMLITLDEPYFERYISEYYTKNKTFFNLNADKNGSGKNKVESSGTLYIKGGANISTSLYNKSKITVNLNENLTNISSISSKGEFKINAKDENGGAKEYIFGGNDGDNIVITKEKLDEKLQGVNTKSPVIENLIRKANIDGSSEIELVEEDGSLTEDGKKYLFTNSASDRKIVENTNIIQAIYNLNNQGTRFFHVNSGEKPIGKLGNEDDKDSDAGSIGSIAIGEGTTVGNESMDSIAIGKSANIGNDSFGSVSIGDGSNISGSNSIALGHNANAIGEQSMALGSSSSSNAEMSTAVGIGSKANNGYGIALGSFAISDADDSISFGTNSNSKGKKSIALGSGAHTLGANSIALGRMSTSTGENSVSIGLESYSKSLDTVSIGNGAKSYRKYGVALGSFSVADRPYGNIKEEISEFTTINSLGIVSVGREDGQRQIINVAGGTEDTDAINLRQLKSAWIGFKADDKRTSERKITETLNIYGDNEYIETSIDENSKDTLKISLKNELVQNIKKMVLYDDSKKNSITLSSNSGDGTKVKNLAVGEISVSSKEAINGSQLYNSNKNISEVLGAKVDVSGKISVIPFANGMNNFVEAINKNTLDIDNIRGKFISHNNDVNKLKSDLSKIDEKIDKNTSDIGQNKQRINEQKMVTDGLKSKFADKGNEVDANDRRIKDLEGLISDQTKTINKNEERINNVLSEMQEKNEEISNNTNEITRLGTEFAESEKKINKNKTDYDTNSKKIKVNLEKIKEQGIKIKDISDKVKIQGEKLLTNEKEIEKNKSDILKINNTLDNFKTSGLFNIKVGKSETPVKQDEQIEFIAGDNLNVAYEENKIKYSLSKNLNKIDSISSNDTLVITSNGNKYKFGGSEDTSVITNEVLENKLKNYVTTDNDSTVELKTDDNSGIKIETSKDKNVTEYKLNLDGDTIKKLAGTITLNKDIEKITNDLIGKGLIFNTNNNKEQTVQLGSKVKIKGSDENTQEEKFDAGKNIMTNITKESDGSASILINLAKELSGLESIKLGDEGNYTTINADGVSSTGEYKILDDKNKVILKIDKTKIHGKNGKKFDSINDALNTFVNDLKDLEKYAVLYDKKTQTEEVDKENITLGDGKNPVLIKNIKNGTISKDSNQAITGAQVYKFGQELSNILGTKFDENGKIQNPSFENKANSYLEAINKNHEKILANQTKLGEIYKKSNDNKKSIDSINEKLKENDNTKKEIDGRIKANEASIKENENKIKENERVNSENLRRIEENKQSIVQNNEKIIKFGEGIKQNQNLIKINNDEINKNKTSISENGKKIEINTNAVKENGGKIQINKDLISKNKETILDHKQKIEKNTKDIEGNLLKINKNTGDINDNKQEILSNKLKIKINENKIEENKQQISSNKNEIDKHTLKLEKHQELIDQNRIDINKNTGKIEENKKLAEQNKGDIEKNSKILEQHSDDILKIYSDLTEKDKSIGNIKTDVDKNKKDIEDNRKDIDKNKNDISKNTEKIKENEKSILENKKNITENKEKIKENNEKIAQNSKDIIQNQKDIQTNKTDISNNKKSIETIEVTLDKFKNTGLFKVKANGVETPVKQDSTVEFIAEHNLIVKNENGKITYSLAENPKFNDLTISDIKLEKSEKGGLKLSKDNKPVTIENVTSGIEWKDDKNLDPLYSKKDDSLNNVVTVKDLQNVAKAGLNFSVDDNKSIHNRLSDTLSIKGKTVDNHQNIKTSANNGIEIALNDDLRVKNSITVGDENKNTTINDKSIVFKNGNSSFAINSDGTVNGVNPNSENSIATVGQVNKVKLNSSQAIASVSAMTTIPQVNENHYFSVGAGVGYYDGSQAIAVGVSGQTESENLVYKASVGFDGNKAAVGAGLNVNIGDKKRARDKEIDKLKNRLSELEEYIMNNKKEEFKEKLFVIDQFENNKVELNNKQVKLLKQIVLEINEKYPDRTIDIIGHTDTNHNEKYNLELGLRRANKVVEKMVELGLKNHHNIRKVSSFGYNNKVNSNELPLNRRVEIYVK